MPAALPRDPLLRCLSVVIPARDEQDAIGATVERLHAELVRHAVPHEIVVVDDGSRDGTWAALLRLTESVVPRFARSGTTVRMGSVGR